jgi:hypothetical protein
MFEVITGPQSDALSSGNRGRTPWTRRFFSRRHHRPREEAISDLVEWTRPNWSDLVLKPERGYSGIGVMVGEAPAHGRRCH